MILCAGNADHTAFNILRPAPGFCFDIFREKNKNKKEAKLGKE